MRSGPTAATAVSHLCSRSSGVSFHLPAFGSRCRPRHGSTSRRPRTGCTGRSRRSLRATFTARGGRRRSRCSSADGRSSPAKSRRGSTMRGGGSERCICARSRRTRRQDWESAERSSAAAVRAGRELTLREPYRETGYRLLMDALARQGNAAEALLVYDQLRTRLHDDLGVAPSTETQELHKQLLSLSSARHRGSRARAPVEARRRCGQLWIRMLLPGPPSRASCPGPPRRTSSPSRPNSLSSPTLPTRTSSSAPPSSVSPTELDLSGEASIDVVAGQRVDRQRVVGGLGVGDVHLRREAGDAHGAVPAGDPDHIFAVGAIDDHLVGLAVAGCAAQRCQRGRSSRAARRCR